MKTLLFLVVSFIAVTSTFSGLLMISNPDGGIMNLPLSLLDGTPFKDFLIPGILLTTIVGGVNLLAVFYNMQRHANRNNCAIAGGIICSGWVVVHFTYLGIGILIILLAYQLKGKWAV